MTFEEAIESMKEGKRIQREGWNGKNQYVELATCISYKNASGEIVNINPYADGNIALAFVLDSGVMIGWIASHEDTVASQQLDMLSNDWKIVEG